MEAVPNTICMSEPPKDALSCPVYNDRCGARFYLKVFLLAAVVTAVIFLPFVIYNRGLFIFYGDYNVQQIPFYQLAQRAIKEGSVSFNLYTDLGVNFIGSYSFYLLGSPFFWLTMPFPTEWLPYLMAPLFVLKFATAATTATAYIKHFVKNRSYALCGGLLYAFSGFSVYNIFFNHFHEVIAFFPLLLLAVELAIQNRKRGSVALIVCLCAVINYFFFVGEVVFVLIYFVIRTVSRGRWDVTVGKFIRLCIEAVIGVGMAAVILTPSYLAIIDNSRVSSFLTGWDMLTYPNVQRYLSIIQTFFFPPDLPARPNFFPDMGAKWASIGAWLPLIGMTAPLAFMKSKTGHFAKRIFCVCAIMALVPVLNSAFFAFNSAYYARWFYMPVLVLSLMTAIALEDGEVDFSYGVRACAVITAGFAVIGLIPSFKTDDAGEKIWSIGVEAYTLKFWVYVLIAALSLVLCGFLFRARRHYGTTKVFVRVLTASVCLVAVVSGMFFLGTGKSESYADDYVIDCAINSDGKLNLNDNTFFRTDFYDDMDNMGMHWGLPTIQAFHSIVPTSVTDFYTSLGIERGVGSRPDQSYVGLRTITSVKYLFVPDSKKKDAEIPEGFYYSGHQNEHDIYVNENYVPMGFCYSSYVDKKTFDTTNQNYRDRLLTRAILLDDSQIEKYKGLFQKLEDTTYFNLSDSKLKEASSKLRNNCCSEFSETKTGFQAKITLKKANLVVFSVPYDKGFTATVNGKNAVIEKVNVGFMAVYCTPGENKIEFTYTTPGLKAGAYISGGSVIVLIFYLLIAHALGRQNRKRVPELLPETAYQASDREAQAEQSLLALSDDVTDDTAQSVQDLHGDAFLNRLSLDALHDPDMQISQKMNNQNGGGENDTGADE